MINKLNKNKKDDYKTFEVPKKK